MADSSNCIGTTPKVLALPPGHRCPALQTLNASDFRPAQCPGKLPVSSRLGFQASSSSSSDTEQIEVHEVRRRMCQDAWPFRGVHWNLSWCNLLTLCLLGPQILGLLVVLGVGMGGAALLMLWGCRSRRKRWVASAACRLWPGGVRAPSVSFPITPSAGNGAGRIAGTCCYPCGPVVGVGKPSSWHLLLSTRPTPARPTARWQAAPVPVADGGPPGLLLPLHLVLQCCM